MAGNEHFFHHVIQDPLGIILNDKVRKTKHLLVFKCRFLPSSVSVTVIIRSNRNSKSSDLSITRKHRGLFPWLKHYSA